MLKSETRLIEWNFGTDSHREVAMKILFAVLMLAALTASTLALPMRSDAKAEELDLLRKALLQRLLDNNMEASEYSQCCGLLSPC